MIIDKIENRWLYSGLGERIAKALEHLNTTDFSVIDPGRYEIEGNKLFAAVSQYNTKDAETAKLEAHKKYIDVQFLVSGSELIGYKPFNNETPTIEYNGQKDVMFFKPEELSYVKLEPGVFSIFFPDDLHQPGVQIKESEIVKKVVIKVLVEDQEIAGINESLDKESDWKSN